MYKKPDLAVISVPSSDDPVWTTLADLDQLKSLIMFPRKWIKDLTPFGQPQMELLENYVIRFRLRAANDRGQESGKDCVVQGISGTNVITVRPIIPLAPQIPPEWEQYWVEWEDDTLTPMGVVLDMDANQGYGHIELTSDADIATRADKIAAFLMVASDRRITFTDTSDNPQYYINRILGKTPEAIVRIDSRTPSDMTPVPIYAPIPFAEPGEPCGLDNVQFTLAQNLSDFDFVRFDTPTACENMAGPITGTSEDPVLGLDDVVIKNYA